MSSPDTRTARSRILGALRSAAPAPAVPAPDLAGYLRSAFGAGVPAAGAAATASLTDAFERAARGWRADVLRAQAADWPQAVRQALDQRGCARVAIGAASPLQPQLDDALKGLQVRRFDRPLEAWKHELFDAIDAGVTSVHAAVADTGSLMLRPGGGEPRTLSLVPPVHVAVLFASSIHPTLALALKALGPEVDMPTNLLLVTGPSKTADIQQTLAYGAHGPKELVIVLVDDLPRLAEAAP